MLGKDDNDGEIRRDFHRTLVRTELLEILVRTSDGRAIKARSRDISLSGVYVVCEEALSAGTEVQLVIGSLSGSAALQIRADVVYVDAGQGFGARYVKPAEEAHGFLEALMKRLRAPAFGAPPQQWPPKLPL